MTITTNTTKKSLFNGRRVWFILAAAAALGAALVVLVIMSALTAKDTYYVLNQDVPARTSVAPSMLTEVQTSAGSAPPLALGLSDVAGGETYTLFALKKGDILTPSNTGDLLSLSNGLPENFVIASFVASPSMAAGGNIQRGDYVDIISIVSDSNITGSEGPSASYVLQRVLVLDATVDLDSYSSDSSSSTTTTSDGTDTSVSSNTEDSSLRSGIPTLFTVGVSPEAAQVLALATQFDIYVVLSSVQSTNDGVVPGAITPASGSSIWGNPLDAGQGTDNTFGQGTTDVTRPEDTNTDVSSPTPEPSGSSNPGDTSTPQPTPTDGTGQ